MDTVIADEIGSIFSRSLIDVVLKISGFSLDVQSTEHDSDFDDNTAVMCLNSNKGGLLFLSAGEDSMKALSSFSEGILEYDLTHEDIEDMLCELVNMTAGSAKLLLTGMEHMFSLTPPFIINGTDMSIATKKRVNVISRTVGNEAIQVKLKVIFY